MVDTIFVRHEPCTLFKTPISGPGASGRCSMPLAFRSTKRPLGAAGCRKPPPRVNGGRRRRFTRADPASRAGVSCWRCFCPTWAQRQEERPFAADEVCRAVLLISCSSAHNPPSRPGAAVSQTACPQLCYAAGLTSSGLLTGCELAAPRSSFSELGHLTANRRSHRHRRRHKAQDALASEGSGGPGRGVLARRRRV